jgi:hypothetical protein
MVPLELATARAGHVFVAVRFTLTPPAPLPEIPTELRDLATRVEAADSSGGRALLDQLRDLRLKYGAQLDAREGAFARLAPMLEGPRGVRRPALGKPGSDAQHVSGNEDLYPSKLDIHGAWFEVPENLETAEISISGYAPTPVHIPSKK